MTVFKVQLTVEADKAVVRSTALGTSSGDFASATDIGALVKVTANDTHGLCADGDEIAGQVTAISEYTVNDGYSHGAVQKSHQIKVLKGNLVAGNLAVAGVQVLGDASVGTAKAGTPTIHKWQCVTTDATHAILEKV